MREEEFVFVVQQVSRVIKKADAAEDFPGLNLSAYKRNKIWNDDIVRKVQAYLVLKLCSEKDAVRARNKNLEAECTRLRGGIIFLNNEVKGLKGEVERLQGVIGNLRADKIQKLEVA